MSRTAEPATGRAVGKLILLGEHAVVHGLPALALGLQAGISTIARPSAGPLELAVPAWDYRIQIDDGSVGSEALAALVTALGAAAAELRLEVATELPAGAGLGSSAALAAACGRALIATDGLERTTDELFEAVQASERVFHGNPSGLDATVALNGGLLRFDRASGSTALRSDPPPHVVVHSGSAGDTAAMVARFADKLDTDHRAAAQLARIGELVEDGLGSLADGDLPALGAALDENHEILRWFGVSTPSLDRVCRIARKAGALGAKLTGGGGGGCAVALTEPGGERSVGAALEAAGYQVVVG